MSLLLALKMEDTFALLWSNTRRSLVFVDELGRGTYGTTLAGAILEEMAAAEMSGIFATHLHGICTLPLSQEANTNLINKRMEFNFASSDRDRKPSGLTN